ncbi:MAG TPA: hypothetical protein VK211_10120 [Kamptonema sp.]|nr:hypothetical protein [Kamptonema sp.]
MYLTAPELTAYCERFLQVIKAGFGQDKQVCATIFQEQTRTPLPVRLVAIYLNKPNSEPIELHPISSFDLINSLKILKELEPEWENVEIEDAFYREEAYFYDSVELNGVKIPTVFFVKPDNPCYWVPSVASEDANQVAADIFEAGNVQEAPQL